MALAIAPQGPGLVLSMNPLSNAQILAKRQALGNEATTNDPLERARFVVETSVWATREVIAGAVAGSRDVPGRYSQEVTGEIERIAHWQSMYHYAVLEILARRKLEEERRAFARPSETEQFEGEGTRFVSPEQEQLAQTDWQAFELSLGEVYQLKRIHSKAYLAYPPTFTALKPDARMRQEVSQAVEAWNQAHGENAGKQLMGNIGDLVWWRRLHVLLNDAEDEYSAQMARDIPLLAQIEKLYRRLARAADDPRNNRRGDPAERRRVVQDMEALLQQFQTGASAEEMRRLPPELRQEVLDTIHAFSLFLRDNPAGQTLERIDTLYQRLPTRKSLTLRVLCKGYADAMDRLMQAKPKDKNEWDKFDAVSQRVGAGIAYSHELAIRTSHAVVAETGGAEVTRVNYTGDGRPEIAANLLARPEADLGPVLHDRYLRDAVNFEGGLRSLQNSAGRVGPQDVIQAGVQYGIVAPLHYPASALQRLVTGEGMTPLPRSLMEMKRLYFESLEEVSLAVRNHALAQRDPRLQIRHLVEAKLRMTSQQQLAAHRAGLNYHTQPHSIETNAGAFLRLRTSGNEVDHLTAAHWVNQYLDDAVRRRAGDDPNEVDASRKGANASIVEMTRGFAQLRRSAWDSDQFLPNMLRGLRNWAIALALVILGLVGFRWWRVRRKEQKLISKVTDAVRNAMNAEAQANRPLDEAYLKQVVRRVVLEVLKAEGMPISPRATEAAKAGDLAQETNVASASPPQDTGHSSSTQSSPSTEEPPAPADDKSDSTS